VFQRTPSFVVPARNAPLSQRERQAIKDEYPALRALAKTRRNGLFCATADVSALAVSDEERRAKAEAEAAALEQLKEENPEAYEKPEPASDEEGDATLEDSENNE
jgi:cation diffusion facilitator CzcD-associated flavoprotein CzcO